MRLKELGEQAARAEAKQGCNGKQSRIFLLLGHRVAPRATHLTGCPLLWCLELCLFTCSPLVSHELRVNYQVCQNVV